MAGEWIKFDTTTPDKPEVWAIADSLDMDPDAVVGKLLRVWTWFDAHTESGNAPSVTAKLLDRQVGCKGFVSAMIDAGWMEDDGHSLTLPNFDRHNGKTAKNRALTNRRVAKSRQSNDGCNGVSVTETVTREEKRREESITPPDGGDVPDGTPDCPHQDIIALYHELLPSNPKVKVWNEERRGWLRARWREDPKRQDLEYWRKFFTFIANRCPFLTGQVEGRESVFLPGLDWMVRPRNFAKIIEGQYRDKDDAA